jgi:hypothetical protein
MAKLIPATEKIARARALIQKARETPVPDGLGKSDFSYMAQVKDLFRQARDLVKFIPQTMGLPAETKDDAKKVLQEIEDAHRELLY